MSWIPWLPAAAGIVVLAWATRDLQTDFGTRQMYLRGGLLLAAMALSFAFDDPAAETTDPTPSPLRVRRSLRLVVSLAPWAALVAVLVWAGAKNMDPVIVLSSPLNLQELPVGRLLLEAATMASWGLAGASFLASRWDDEPGKIASGALLVVYAAAWMIPERWKPWTNPTEPRWATALPWWWVALTAGILVTVVFSWDSRQVRTPSSHLRRRPPQASYDTHATKDQSGVEAAQG